MPADRMRGLALPKPLSLDQFVALIMSPSDRLGSEPKFNKQRIHPQHTRVNTQIVTTLMSPSSKSLEHKITDKPILPLINMGPNPDPDESAAMLHF